MKGIIFAVLMFVAPSSVLALESCNPRNYFDTDFSSLRDFERMIVLSTISETKFKEAVAKHSGEIIIPYINVPAKGDFSLTKTIVNQMHQMMASDITSMQEETILRSSLSELGVEAYLACVNRMSLILSVPTSALYDPFVIVELYYNGPTNDSGIIEPPLIAGGKVISEVATEVNDEGKIAFLVERNLDEKLVLGVVVHGKPNTGVPSMVHQIQLPARPKKELRFDVYRYPEDAALLVQSGHPGYGVVERTECFAAPEGVIFVQGTVSAIIESLHGADMGSYFRAYDDTSGLRVCAHAYANAAVKHRGAQASGWASIIGMKTVDVIYPPLNEGVRDIQP